MLHLQCSTNPEWVHVATQNLDKILIDHAHCEKKAAGFALAMITRYPSHTMLVKRLIDLAKEELDHFEFVINELELRGITLPRDKGTKYAQELHKLIAKNEPDRLLDSLIIGSFIEARSCERFSLLAEHTTDPVLQKLYAGLLASEAGHYRLYTDIAREYFSVAKVKKRVKEIGAAEAEIVATLPNIAMMHG